MRTVKIRSYTIAMRKDICTTLKTFVRTEVSEYYALSYMPETKN